MAEIFLIEQNLSFSSHAAVISVFGQYCARPGIVPVDFHRYLIDAQAMRTRGDYDIDSTFSAPESEEQIYYAEQFIDFAVQLLGE